ncbi:MAG: ABC transporter ATP-binding protein, partial [Armatimonadetes bacterium]
MGNETPIIETDGLTKYYGDVPGIIELDLSVEQGEVFGFLGPNGAGKTTTIRILLNFLFPTSGSARVLGLDVVRDSLEIRRRIGYLPGDLALYDTMTARELFLYFSNLRGVKTTTRIAELADRFDLDLDR